MEDYKSKYSGEQVDALLDQVASGNAGGGGGGVAVEVDPIFSASAAAGITANDIAGWNNKVDKVNGKQLSTEDFTAAMKQKLEGLSNYDDTELSEAVETLRGDFDELVSGDTTTAIKTFNEVIAFLDGIQDSQDLSSIIASIEQQIAGKMDNVTLATVATSGSYNDLSNKPTIPSAVTESTVSGWGFTKNTGTYSKPSGGIPKSDLASAVQTSLGKADTALQSYTEQYKGTVTGVKINGSTKSPDSNGLVDLGTIEGGGGSSSGGGGSAEKEVLFANEGLIEELEPNKIYILENLAPVFEIQSIVEPDGFYAEYTVVIYAENTAGGNDYSPTIILPENVRWANGVIPDLTQEGCYELSIVYVCGLTNSSYNAVLTCFKPI